MGERRGVYRIVLGKPERKRPFGNPVLNGENNIKLDLQEVACGSWTGLFWLRVGTGG